MISFDFLTGVAVGIILFQSALIAPTVLKTLDAESTRTFLRSIWPQFFLVLILIGGPAAVVKIRQDDLSMLEQLMAAFLIILPVLAYVITPATNRAADREDHARFKVLHRLSVLSTLALLADYVWLALARGPSA